MASSSLDEAFALLEQATKLEQESNNSSGDAQQKCMQAAAKYYEACYLMKRHVNRMPVNQSSRTLADANDKTKSLIMAKVKHYEHHAAELLKRTAAQGKNEEKKTSTSRGMGGPSASSWDQTHQFKESWNSNNENGSGGGGPTPFSSGASVASQSNFLHPAAASTRSFQQSSYNNSHQQEEESLVMEKASQANVRLAFALDHDESKNTKKALEAYMEAARLYLDALEIAKKRHGGGGGEQEGELSLCDTLKRRLEGALDRVEELKHPGKVSSSSSSSTKKTGTTRSLRQTAPLSKTPSVSKGTLSATEIAILKRSSTIASGLFMPWSDDEIASFDFGSGSSSTLWTDPDGILKLSEKQNQRMYKWARPSEILQMRNRRQSSSKDQRPVMVSAITPYSIRQKYVTDCSFIASLCICASFERRFNRRLVTSIIYPQDGNGFPVYNKAGKYVVKLWLNGVARRVIVDDHLPVDSNGNLLCSHTTCSTPLELWVSIIEKAYMKLCGGYDFPGSNSGVDLFSLTGWIPERIFFPENPSAVRDFETPSERAWERLFGAISYGDCLITVSTSSEISKEKADEVGLVTGHAYAVLSAIKTRNGTRLLQLKNPWAHKGWQGRYSCHDRESWRDQSFCAEVGYDPEVAAKFDDGVFWICWEDMMVYFRNLHLSWNPALFSSRTTIHGYWPEDMGPLDDSFNIGDNPQYVLTLSEKAIKSRASLWILLSRHVTKQEQEGCEATDYLTLHVHRNTENKEKLLYPGGKKCVLNGAYTNNQHVLVRYDVTGVEDRYLTIVLSQYQKSNDLAYTLSCYCTSDFTFGRPRKDPPHITQIASEWTDHSAGGPPGQPGFATNPMWSLTIPSSGVDLQLKCSAIKTFAINLMLIKVNEKNKRVQWVEAPPVIDTGDYRHGFVATNAMFVPGGTYTLVASTFYPGQMGGFNLTVNSTATLRISPIA